MCDARPKNGQRSQYNSPAMHVGNRAAGSLVEKDFPDAASPAAAVYVCGGGVGVGTRRVCSSSGVTISSGNHPGAGQADPR